MDSMNFEVFFENFKINDFSTQLYLEVQHFEKSLDKCLSLYILQTHFNRFY